MAARVRAPDFGPELPWPGFGRPLSLRGQVACMHVVPDLHRPEAKCGDRQAVPAEPGVAAWQELVLVADPNNGRLLRFDRHSGTISEFTPR
ncbi:MAG: hypothetical protein ACOY4L_11570 [Pseudomonadota bacterium]